MNEEEGYTNDFLLNKFVPKLYEINEVESISFERTLSNSFGFLCALYHSRLSAVSFTNVSFNVFFNFFSSLHSSFRSLLRARSQNVEMANHDRNRKCSEENFKSAHNFKWKSSLWTNKMLAFEYEMY